ncbi:MAG: hypothetical protein ACRCWQ_10815 [Bacilli bacterium]
MEPPVVPEEPIRIDVPFNVMNAILAEVTAGKTITEAVKVDSRVATLFADHPYIIARESRNSFFYALKEGVEPKATRSYDGVWSQPVSYALDK